MRRALLLVVARGAAALLLLSAPCAAAAAAGSTWAGLRNQGNTCYLNALLQTLFHVPRVRESVVETPAPRRGPLARFRPMAPRARGNQTSRRLRDGVVVGLTSERNQAAFSWSRRVLTLDIRVARSARVPERLGEIMAKFEADLPSG